MNFSGTVLTLRIMEGLNITNFRLFTHWTLTFTVLALLVLLENCRVECVIGQSYLSPEPTTRVYLFSLERGPLLTISETPNSDVVLTKPPGYFEAYMFECNATFPIQWTYGGEAAPIMTVDVGRSFRNFYDPATYMYHATMIMYNLDEQNTGRYVCRGIEQQHYRVSVYLHLYVPGEDVLLSTTEKTVHVPPRKDHLTIPCGASDPTTVVNLYKGNHKGSYVRLETNSSIVYNPRKGFRIQHHALADPYGKYLCVAQSSKKRVRVTVLPKADRVKRHVPEHVGGYGDVSIPAQLLEFSYDNRYHRMLCCSASGFAPKLTYAGCTSIVDCEIKSACFRENKCEPRDDMSSYYNKYVGLDPPGCTGASLRDDLNGDHGLFLCQDPTNSATEYQPFQLTHGNLYMNFETAPEAELIMTLNRQTDEELFVGSETEFRCNSSKFFFGFGLRWAFEKIGGELEFVAENDVVNDAFFLSAHRRHTVLKIPHANIKSVLCVAPVWNSPTEWRIISLPISISRIFRPSPPENVLSAADGAAPPSVQVPLAHRLSTTYTQPDPHSEHMQKLRRRILPLRTKSSSQPSVRKQQLIQERAGTPYPVAPALTSPRPYIKASREELGRKLLYPVVGTTEETPEPLVHRQNTVVSDGESEDGLEPNIHKYYYDTLDDVLLGRGGDLPQGRGFTQLTPEEAGLGIYNSTFDLRSIL